MTRLHTAEQVSATDETDLHARASQIQGLFPFPMDELRDRSPPRPPLRLLLSDVRVRRTPLVSRESGGISSTLQERRLIEDTPSGG